METAFDIQDGALYRAPFGKAGWLKRPVKSLGTDLTGVAFQYTVF